MAGARIIFMGTPAFALPSLEELFSNGHDIRLVITQPDRPKGRGRALEPSPVKKLALEKNLKVMEPLKLRDEDFIKNLKALEPDLFVVVAYGRILPKAVLEIPKYCVNLHASLLPKYRGAAPINWAIINGDKETGVSTMLMDEGMDTGPVLLEEKTAIGDGETAEELSKRLSRIGAKLLGKTIKLLIEDKITPVQQDNEKATYAPILKKEDGRIDWSKGASEIKNLVRGFYPWPGAFTNLNGKLIKIHSGRAIDDFSDNAKPGEVLESSKGIMVKCGKGAFEITELQPENKKRMSAADFLKGYKLERDERFS